MADVNAILVQWMVLPLLIVICLFNKVADVIAFMYVVDEKNQKNLVYCVSSCYCYAGRWNDHPGWVLFGRC